MNSGTPGASGRGLRGALAQLGAALLGIARTRLELVALEVGEVRARATEQLVLILVAGLLFAFALLAASALVVVLYWDTYRIAALCGVTIAYVVLGLIALWRLALTRKTGSPPFAGTLAELERDRAWMANEFGDNK